MACLKDDVEAALLRARDVVAVPHIIWPSSMVRLMSSKRGVPRIRLADMLEFA